MSSPVSAFEISHPGLQRKTLLTKWNNRCVYCDRPLVPVAKRANPGKVTKDHFLPKAHGGRGGLFNTVPCCKSCNLAKGAIDPRRVLWVWLNLDPEGLVAFLNSYAEDPGRGPPPPGLVMANHAAARDSGGSQQAADVCGPQ